MKEQPQQQQQQQQRLSQTNETEYKIIPKKVLKR